MSNYHRIDGCNMVNGRGIRTVIWLSGCPHHCKGCFSPQTWNEKGGIPFDEEAYKVRQRSKFDRRNTFDKDSSKMVSFVHFFCIGFIFLFINSVQKYRKYYYLANNNVIIIICLIIFFVRIA